MTSFLVTGGTGSFGQAFIRRLLTIPSESEILEAGRMLDYKGKRGMPWFVDRVVVFSRDELKQHEMRHDGFDDERIRWFIGDVRDRDRLRRAMHGIDVVVHAAAMKQVGACEYNPSEAVLTNIGGARNVIDAALDCGVKKVLALGTDKAVDPVNLYGATKLAAEKLFVAANAYSGHHGTIFAGTRYGNVLNSRGSVLPVFQAQHRAGMPLTVTDPGMTRFVLTLEQGVQFVLDSLGRMVGGEVFVPRLPAVTVATIAAAVTWPKEPAFWGTGMRQGDKRHERLVSMNESVVAYQDHFVISPDGTASVSDEPVALDDAQLAFSSDTAERLDVSAFRRLAGLGGTLEEATA